MEPLLLNLLLSALLDLQPMLELLVLLSTLLVHICLSLPGTFAVILTVLLAKNDNLLPNLILLRFLSIEPLQSNLSL